MKKSILLAVVLVGVAVLSTSCDLFGGKADYYPLGIGSIWNYTLTTIMSDTSGTLNDTTVNTVKVDAVKEEQLGSGEKVVMLVNALTDTTDATYYDTSYARKDGEKVLAYSDLNDTNPDLILNGPPAMDKTWTVNEDITAKIVAKENVTVTAGTYKNCWKVELTSVMDADTMKYYMWFADGTGNVKYFASATNMGVTVTMTEELTSATIK